MKKNRTYKYAPGNFDLSRFKGREFILSQTTLSSTTYTLFARTVKDNRYTVPAQVLADIWEFVVRVEGANRYHDIKLHFAFIVEGDSELVRFIPEDVAIQDYGKAELEQLKLAHSALIKAGWYTIYKALARAQWQRYRLCLELNEPSYYGNLNPHANAKASYLIHFAQVRPLQTALLTISLFDTATYGLDVKDWPVAQEFENLARLALS